MRNASTLLSENIAADPALGRLLAELARKYVWWKTADLALRHPALIVAKVMDVGDYDDVQRMAKRVGDECLRHVIQDAEIGQFSERSWAFWHYRLGQPPSSPVPPMPQRQLQDKPQTWTILVAAESSEADQVKVSFFGGIDIGRVGEPSYTDDRNLEVASLDDLLATKLKVLLQRVESKDYLDIAAMLGAGIGLAKGLAAARAMYGSSFQPSESLKALTYFKVGDLEVVPDDIRTTLIEAASAVGDLPTVELRSRRLPGSRP